MKERKEGRAGVCNLYCTTIRGLGGGVYRAHFFRMDWEKGRRDKDKYMYVN